MQPAAEIEEQLQKANDGINEGSQYPGMSYEDGIKAFCRLVDLEIRTKNRFEE